MFHFLSPLFFSAFFIFYSCLNFSSLSLAEEVSTTSNSNSNSNSQQVETEIVPSLSSSAFTWLNGNNRQTTSALETKYFTGQFTFDANSIYSFANPKDHSLVGSTNSGRTGEMQIQQLGVGGDFHYQNIRGRFLTQLGMYSTMTPRNDASPGRGQWNTSDAYRYLSEAYAGYHWDTWSGINLDAGIFMSYVGLCSYYNFENWIYQMSYVSANTPWFFNGVRLQMFPIESLKVELFVINGWQSYGVYNDAPGFGGQFLWRPFEYLSLVSNNYYGSDTLGKPGRIRIHSDNSVQLKYYDQPKSFISKGAFSFTMDFGCEYGEGVKCSKQNFLGLMFYNRLWFHRDLFALTLGGGMIKNPGRYLVLLPSINGATASTSSPYFTQNPGDDFKAWDSSVTFDILPNENLTLRMEYIHRQANVPYFAGREGITPAGGNNGAPANVISGFTPGLTKSENRINMALLIRL